ncbi:MAG TPA: pseudouridine synthase [Pirellulales bacterium]|nr:pseudouridine synthase [Pirellulales bacterium]
MKRTRGAYKSGLPSRPRPAESAADGDAGAQAERLQKVMARAGVGSRRQCEELIAAGRVQIDGRAVTELGTKVARGQQVVVDGTPLGNVRLVHYVVNKPVGVVSTNFDPSGRPRVIDLLPQINERLFAVGRLDMSSEGLILVTNDGELANRLAHPRYGVEKTYLVQVAGTPDREVIATLRRGVHLAEGLARATQVRVKKTLTHSSLLEIVLSEGKNREIRRILAKVGHKVLRLKRIAIGPVRLAQLPSGEFRPLTPEELKELRGHRPCKPAARKRAVANARPHLRPTGVRANAMPAPSKQPAKTMKPGTGTIILPDEEREAKGFARREERARRETPGSGAGRTPRTTVKVRGRAADAGPSGPATRHKKPGGSKFRRKHKGRRG